MLRTWDDLPDFMKTPEVKPYWDVIYKKRRQIVLKRILDVIVALVLIVILAVPMLFISIMIKLDTPGPVMFRQERVTLYGNTFYIHKFRSMSVNSQNNGSSVTTNEDSRITKTGKKLRRLRLDEIPQLFDIINGSMSFVGTRPEIPKYVKEYKPEYYATLLLPAGVTSEASIRFKDEERLLESSNDLDSVYVESIIPLKMEYNLKSLEKFSLADDFSTVVRTVSAVLGKEYK